MWEIAQGNARIANHLETRGEDLAALTTLLESLGLTVADLVAFERQQNGISPFAPTQPDYMVPARYRRADRDLGDDLGEEES